MHTRHLRHHPKNRTTFQQFRYHMSQKLNLWIAILPFVAALSMGGRALASDYPKPFHGKWRLTAGDEACSDPFQFNKRTLELPGGGVCRPKKIQRIDKHKFKIIETCQSGLVRSETSMIYSVSAEVLTIAGPTERQLYRCPELPSGSTDTEPTAVN
jgi:hypothetical protein